MLRVATVAAAEDSFQRQSAATCRARDAAVPRKLPAKANRAGYIWLQAAAEPRAVSSPARTPRSIVRWLRSGREVPIVKWSQTGQDRSQKKFCDSCWRLFKSLLQGNVKSCAKARKIVLPNSSGITIYEVWLNFLDMLVTCNALYSHITSGRICANRT